MKNTITKLTCLAFVAAILAAAPAISRAADTNAPAATAPKKHSNVFHGKVVAVDAAAMTFTIGTTTAVVNSSTKVTKDEKPAVFADIKVGETVACAYKKDDAGKNIATSVKITDKKKPAASMP